MPTENASDHVLLFTKYPVAGYAKTRLIPAVGAEHAAEISRQLTKRIVTTLRRMVHEQPQIQAHIHYAIPKAVSIDDVHLRAWLGQAPDREHLILQKSGDLGQRLTAAFENSFEQGAQKVVVVGADIPEIDLVILSQALDNLQTHDIVIGPAQDGGYYLLGMKTLHASLFSNIPWSTETVFSTTMHIAQSLNLSVFKLAPLRDVDNPDDLPYYNSLFQSKS